MGRLYTNQITINSTPGGGGSVSIYAVTADPTGTLDANAGDRAFEIGTNRTWVCTGGTAWEEIRTATLPVIVRPSAPDPAAGIYATFEEAFAAASAQATENLLPVTIYIDEYNVSIELTTVGTYDFLGLINIDSFTEEPYYLNTYEGVVFTGFQRGFATGEVYHDGVTPLVTVTSGPFEEYYVGPRAGFMQLGAGPVYQFTNLSRLNLLSESYTIDTAIFVEANVILVIFLHPGSTLAPDSVASTDPATLLNITYLWTGTYSAQAGFVGTVLRSGEYPAVGYASIAPAVNTPVQPLTVNKAPLRFVFGTLTLAASAGNAASINWQVETGVGTGAFTTVQSFTQPAGDTPTRQYGYGFFVPAGLRYRWTRGGLGGTTETIAIYNLMDNYSF